MQFYLIPALGILIYFFYSIALFRLGFAITEKWRFTSYLQYLLMLTAGIFFLLLSFFMPIHHDTFPLIFFPYIFISALFLFDISLFTASVMSAVIVFYHLVYRAIITASEAFYYGIELFHLAENTSFYKTTSLVLLCVAITCILIKRCVPTYYLKAFTLNHKHIKYTAAWLFLLDMYLLFVTLRYSNPFLAMRPSNLLLLGIVLFIATHLMFAAMFSAHNLIDYKDRVETLTKIAAREKLLKELALTESLLAIEINCTKNSIVRTLGSVEYGNSSSQESGYHSYRDTILNTINLKVHPDYKALFAENMRVENLLAIFEEGKKELHVDYLRLIDQNQYRWVRSTVKLEKDMVTDDIMAIMYVRDIDKEKRQALELKYRAERDSLTGLYNFPMAKKLISEKLYHGQEGILFLVDLDNFASINQTLGNGFGDKVLCDCVKKIGKIFRKEDILARIGGDEFLIFIKNTASLQHAHEKAQALSRTLSILYKDSPITASIGVALFPLHGMSFDAIYQHADTALYISKVRSKNTYTIYDGEVFKGYSGKRTPIESEEQEKPNDNDQYSSEAYGAMEFETISVEDLASTQLISDMPSDNSK